MKGNTDNTPQSAAKGQLLLGNAAIARGLWEAGCAFISSYPGTPSTEITEEEAAFGEIWCEWAANEKVALEAAHGATVAGVRAACAMKHVGLNVAADPLFTISYQGLNAGLVICVADDPAMHSSQNEQDSRHYAIAAKVPMLEPSDSSECLSFAKRAYELSDEFCTPVLLRTTTRISHAQSVVHTSDRKDVPRVPYKKDAGKVMMGAAARAAHERVEKRTQAIAHWAECSDINRIEGTGRVGVITSGACYQYVKEAMGDAVRVLKLGMVFPLPQKLICSFAESVDELYVVEELDPIIESYCRSLSLSVRIHGKDVFPTCGEISPNMVAHVLGKAVPPTLSLGEGVTLPARPPAMCAGCPHRGVFWALKKARCMAYGDIGCYTLGAVEPLCAMDLNVCMGASVSGLHGFVKAGGKEAAQHSVAVIGDSTFVHSGITGLASIAYNGSASTVIILDNSITGMTGHQQNPSTGKNLYGDPTRKVDLEALCRAVGVERVRVVDPYDLAALDEALSEELSVDEPSVIISRRPCVMIRGVAKGAPLSVDSDKCKGCRSCMRIGCPALSFREGKACVDEAQCTGCAVCSQLCAFGAFSVQGGL